MLNGRLKKNSLSSSANSQYFFMKISWIGPWFSKIYWCKGHWCSLTYMVQAPKQAKNAFFEFLGCFRAYVRQPHDHIDWATSMPFASINPTNLRTNPWNFHKKHWELAELENEGFLSRPFWIFFASFQWKRQPVHIRYHFFLHYGWFLQILGKRLSELICTRL